MNPDSLSCLALPDWLGDTNRKRKRERVRYLDEGMSFGQSYKLFEFVDSDIAIRGCGEGLISYLFHIAP